MVSAYIVFKTNEGEGKKDGRTLRARVLQCGWWNACPPAVDRIGTPTATTFPPSSSAAAALTTTLCLMVMGAGRGRRTEGRTEDAGENHLPLPPPPVAFRTSSINVKRANSRIKLGSHLHAEE